MGRKKVKESSQEEAYDGLAEYKEEKTVTGKGNQTRNANDYKKAKKVEHVLLKPTMWIGSTKQIERKAYHMFQPEEDNEQEARVFEIKAKKTIVPFAMCHIFQELVSNTGDNVKDSIKCGIDPGECIITIKKNRITIVNNGLCIPIEKDANGVYIPESAFGRLLSGSNMGSGDGGGTHGIGAKGANIMSKEFTLDISNPTQKKRYQQTWTRNTYEKTEPVITKYKEDKSIISISYTIDHQRFGYEEEKFTYPESAIEIFRWQAASLSFTANIPVTFTIGKDTQRFEYNLATYAKLYSKNISNNFIIQRDQVRAIFIDTPSKGMQVGFCNYVYNSDGGDHIDIPLKMVAQEVKSLLERRKKESDPKIKITLPQIKKHATVIISLYRIKDPDYHGGQTKTIFKGPMPEIDIPSEAKKSFKNWGIAREIINASGAKYIKTLYGKDPTKQKGKYIYDDKGDDANILGVESCCFGFEGDSAEGYLDEYRNNLTKEEKDRTATFIFKGKPLNVFKASNATIGKNEELKALIRKLGLEDGLDYTIEKNYKKLRYGKFIIATDADLDGAHIKALIIVFFYRFHPSLLERGDYLYDFKTPCIRVFPKKEDATVVSYNKAKRFYTDGEYKKWLDTLEVDALDKWVVKYYKGLGSSEPQDIQQDSKVNDRCLLYQDKDAGEQLLIAMSNEKEYLHKRKEWINAWNPENVRPIKKKKILISRLVDDQLREFSVYSLKRGLPSFSGLNHVGNKIIWGAFDFWGRGCGSKKCPKITELAGKIGDLTNYHHGGTSMEGAIITMGQAFTGSNNMPFIVGKGQFGNIKKGPKPAQARYLHAEPSPIMPLCFRKEDDPLLVRDTSEGKVVEPVFWLGILPFILMNGSENVVTGWVSKIPQYHPREIAQVYIDRINGIPFPELTPWSRGFKGDVQVRGNVVIYTGMVENVTETDFDVTCLPVGKWGNDYKNWILKKIMSGEISEYEHDMTSTKVGFKIRGYRVKTEDGNFRDVDVRKLSMRDVNLVNTMKLTNINLIGLDGKAVHYESISELMEAFFQFRRPYYQKRKDNMMEILQQELGRLKERLAYIRAIVDGKLKLTKEDRPRKREEILKDIGELKLNWQFYLPSKGCGYKPVKDHNKDEVGIQELEKEIGIIEKKIKEIKKIKIDDMWKDDIQDFLKGYDKLYTDDHLVTYI